MSIELYRDRHHVCLMFSDLVDQGGEGVQANQFLIEDHGVGAIIDPGGNLAFNEIYLTVTRHLSLQKLQYLLASHADPDIIASLDRWLTCSPAKLVISKVWERFAPHFAKAGKTGDRIIGVPDEGGRLRVGEADLWLVPAHFLHSEGNFQFYDPVSRILFTGDLGVSMMPGNWISPCWCRSMARPSRAARPSTIFSNGWNHCSVASTCSTSATTACRSATSGRPRWAAGPAVHAAPATPAAAPASRHTPRAPRSCACPPASR